MWKLCLLTYGTWVLEDVNIHDTGKGISLWLHLVDNNRYETGSLFHSMIMDYCSDLHSNHTRPSARSHIPLHRNISYCLYYPRYNYSSSPTQDIQNQHLQISLGNPYTHQRNNSQITVLFMLSNHFGFPEIPPPLHPARIMVTVGLNQSVAFIFSQHKLQPTIYSVCQSKTDLCTSGNKRLAIFWLSAIKLGTKQKPSYTQTNVHVCR